MLDKLPVVAAIPNYNMADYLSALLPQVLERGYDDVYVLDDASTDDSRKAVFDLDDNVHFVAGRQNVGPGANRNRIADVLGHEAIIHFIDADVQLVSENNPQIIRSSFERPDVGAVGGLVQLPDGTPWMFNYGPRYSLFSMVAGGSQAVVADLQRRYPVAGRLADKATSWRHRGFPDISKTPMPKPVYWTGEANFCITSRLFDQIGGFDPRLGYHEAQDLAIKLHRLGYVVRFEPALAVEHTFVDLGELKRKARSHKAGRHLIRKYGLPLK